MDGLREEPYQEEDSTPQSTTTIATGRIAGAENTCQRTHHQHIGANDQTRERHLKPHYHHHSQPQQQHDEYHHVSHSPPPNSFHQYAYQNFLRRLSIFPCTGHSFDVISTLRLIVIIFVLCLLTKAAMSTTTITTTVTTSPSSVHIDQRHTAVEDADADHSEEEDEATKLFYAIDPMTPDPHTSDPYDRPEDADTLALPGSIWYELSINYKNAPLSRINDGAQPALCLLSVMYTSATTPTRPIVKGRSESANDNVIGDDLVADVDEDAIGGRCRWLHETFRECVLRHGTLRFQKTLSEKCRGSQYWQKLRQTLLAEEKEAVNGIRGDRSGSNHREHNGTPLYTSPTNTHRTITNGPPDSNRSPTPSFASESPLLNRPNPLLSLPSLTPSSDSVPPPPPPPPPLPFSFSSLPLSGVPTMGNVSAENNTNTRHTNTELYTNTCTPTTTTTKTAATTAAVNTDTNNNRTAGNKRRVFGSLSAAQQNTRTENVGGELFKGQVFEAEVCFKDRPPPRYIAPSERYLSPMGPPRRCVGRGAGYGSSGSIPQYPFHVAMPAINFHQKIQQQQLQQVQVKQQQLLHHKEPRGNKHSKRSVDRRQRNATADRATTVPNTAHNTRSNLNSNTPRSETRLVLMPKLWDIAPFLLDQPNGKIFGRDDEDMLRTVYGLSKFCLTHARGGWDCLRHVEAMSMGCILLWYDVHAAGPFILPHLPKAFLKTVVKLPIFSHLGYVKGTKRHNSERFVYAPHKALPPSLSSPLPTSSAFLSTVASVNSSSSAQQVTYPKPGIAATTATNTHGRENPFISETLQNGRSRVVFKHEPYGFYPSHFPSTRKGTSTSFPSSSIPLNQTWYWENARRTLEYARRYLTSEAMAAYMLKTMGAENARHVLIISRHEFDSLHHSLIVGLDGLGVNMTIISESHHRLHTCIEVVEDEAKGTCNATYAAAAAATGVGGGKKGIREKDGYLEGKETNSSDNFPSKKCGCEQHLHDSSVSSSCSFSTTAPASSFSSLSQEELVHRRTAMNRDHTTYSHGIPTAHRMRSRHLRFVNTFADLMPLFDEGVTCGRSLLSAMLAPNGHILPPPPPPPRAVGRQRETIVALGSIEERKKSKGIVDHNSIRKNNKEYDTYAARAESERLSRMHEHVYRNVLNEGQRQLIEALRTRMITDSDQSSVSSSSSSSPSVQRLPSLFDAAIVTYYGRRVFHQPPADYLDLLLGTKRRRQQHSKKSQQTQASLGEDYTSSSAFFVATAHDGGNSGGGVPDDNDNDDMQSTSTLSNNKSNPDINSNNMNRNSRSTTTSLLSFLPLIQWDRVVAKGRVAVVDHRDTREDPAKGSLTVAEKVFFFSRELRRSNC